MAAGDPIIIGVNLDTAGFLSAMRTAPCRATRLVRKMVLVNAIEAANKANVKLTQIQNPKREKVVDPKERQGGGTAQGIHATRPAHEGDTIFSEIKWSNPLVGAMLEWGPKKKVWSISAKYAGALRFGWPTAPQGGFTAIAVGSKGGERIMKLQENTFYFKRVKHVDRPSHRRVHIKPAMEQQEPIFIRDMARIPREVLK